ncbi:recombinase family protein [Methanococcoides methylutens]|uniref:Putative resolvase n=1 Tax=Methanococcoides methylutens MM1 TaxID=1434104 RepID=A0A0E3SS71_METMT|nr:recombinase family protein [Methanococcoides methylutens]AKB85986.1 putative resolvase [Methanococcoides methylutens MM1]
MEQEQEEPELTTQHIMEYSVGYARTSTKGKLGTREQNIETQILKLKELGIPAEHIFFDEGISGSVHAKDRKGFQDMMKFIQSKDITKLYTFEISRLGRTFYNTLTLFMELEQDGVQIISLSPNETWTKTEDTNIRKLFISLFTWVAENERRTTQERIKIGIERHKKEKGKWGKPRREINRRAVAQYRANGSTWEEIARKMDIPSSTLRDHRKRWEREDQLKRIEGAGEL